MILRGFCVRPAPVCRRLLLRGVATVDESLLDRIKDLEQDRADDRARIVSLETDRADNRARIVSLETDRTDDRARIVSLDAKLQRLEGFAHVLEPASLNVALTIALGTYTKAMILLLAAQRGDFFEVLTAFHDAEVLDGQTQPLPHPPANGKEALLLAIARMKFLVPSNSTYVPSRIRDLHATVGSVLLGLPLSSALNLVLVRTTPGGSVRRARNVNVHEMPMRRFAIIAQNVVLYAREPGQALSQDWFMLSQFFYHIHGFAIEEAVVKMTDSQLDDPLLVMYNPSEPADDDMTVYTSFANRSTVF